jgi:CheY-like chemotaxis protein
MPSRTTSRPLIVVADPDVAYAALMTRELRLAGYETLTTAHGAELLEFVEERRPDAVIVEVAIRGTTGYSLVREIRERPENRLMPIVMVSPRAGKLDRDFAFTVGADRYVRKPFPYADIVAHLTQLAPVAAPEPVRARRRRRIYVPIPEPILLGP